MRDCGACGRTVSSGWPGSRCPHCGATLYAALTDATMNVATAALALVFGAALVMMGGMMSYEPERIYVLLSDDVTGPGDWCKLETLATALRPLLAQPEQPTTPAVDWSKAPAWAQWHAVDETGFGYWYSHEPKRNFCQWVSDGKQPDFRWCADGCYPVAPYAAWRDSLTQRLQPATTPNVWALDAAKQRAELALADAQQECEALRAQVARLTAERDEAMSAGDALCAELVQLHYDHKKLAAKWAAIPWNQLNYPVWDLPTSEWYSANRPPATD